MAEIKRTAVGGISAICLAMCLNASVEAQPKAGAPPVQPGDPLEDAIKALKAEADQYFNEKSEAWVPMARPRPAVAKVPAEMYEKVLQLLPTKFSPDVAKDMFIRHHLMWVVYKGLPTATKQLDAALLRRLIKALPETIPYEELPVEIYEPPEIAKRYYAAWYASFATVGFPPFQRRIPPPESFEYMSGAELAKAKANYAEALSLKGKFKVITNVPNDRFNRRMYAVNWALRNYRGEMYLALIAKNPSGVDDLAEAIARSAGTNERRAQDLAVFMNLAYSNGFLAGVEKQQLAATARKLKLAAAAAEKTATKPKPAGKTPPVVVTTGWEFYGNQDRWRNLAETLFNVITGIETDHVPPAIPADQFWRPVPEVAATPVTTRPGKFKNPAAATQATTKAAKPATDAPAPLKPEEITVDDIDAAIARALPALERLRGPEADLGNGSYLWNGLPHWPSDLWAPGAMALPTWAMLSSGDSYRAGWMQRRVNWVLGSDTSNTYDRAMRLQMLAMAPPSERKAIIPWVKRDTQFLIDTMTEHGGWEAANTGLRSSNFGDNANSQYAMLGLWGSSQAGYEVPNATWQRVDKFWREGQRPPGAPGEGAWAVTSSAALQKGADLKSFTNQVSASMTAGGVLSLFITESFLYGDKRADVGQTLSPELLKGVKWLDENFSLDKLDGDSDFYYYTWTIQNVGQATGYRTFNKVDWFRETTARLINTQGKNGLWDGPKGSNVSTSFALLYLYRARGPLAICKLKIDSIPVPGARTTAVQQVNWNNRPNDLYNLTRDISKKTEIPTSWQIADLDQPVYQLIESPVLYMATNSAFKLSDAHVARLKEYLAAGGMLVCVPEGKMPVPVTNSFKALAEELCPGSEGVARKPTDKHAFYTLFAEVKGHLPTITYENSVRPLVVIIERDIGQDLQMNRVAQREGFDLLENIYLYATGKNAKRSRISTNYLTKHNQAPKQKIAVARINFSV
jgi:hypothetical protein